MKRMHPVNYPALMFLLTQISFSSCKQQSHEARLQAEIEKTVQMDSETADGKKLYVSNGCAACHGVTGRGDGPAAAALNPKPRNYREIFAYVKGFSVAEISQTIFDGVPGTAMIGFAGINAADREKIAKYVVFLQNQP